MNQFYYFKNPILFFIYPETKRRVTFDSDDKKNSYLCTPSTVSHVSLQVSAKQENESSPILVQNHFMA